MKRQHFTTQLSHRISEAPWWIGAFGIAAALFIPQIWPSSALAYVGSWLLGLICAFGLLDKIRRASVFLKASDIESIRNLSWRDFETLVGEAYRRMGYSVEELGGSGPDGGVDLKLTRGQEIAYIQCKHWQENRVGVKPVRELYGVAAGRACAIFVTSGTYTAEALAFGRDRSVELIDGRALVELLRDVRSNVRSGGQPTHAPVQSAVVYSHASQASADTPRPVGGTLEQTIAGPTCPRCGSAMVLRTAKRGANAGRQFWGCGRYPDCRGIVDLPHPHTLTA